MATDSKDRKNPLNQAFGMVLRRAREDRDWSLQDMEKWSGLKGSYIQQVEKGQFNLHVSNCVALYKAFKRDVRKELPTLEGLMQLLSTISVLEARGKENVSYISGIANAAIELSENDGRLKKLLDPFFAYGVFESNNSEEAQRIIVENSIHDLVGDFLVNYRSFETPYIARQEAVLSNFFDEVPSIYFEYLKTSKENILNLPFQIAFSGLSQWEDQNIRRFQSMICISAKPNAVMSEKNLSQYSYKYLWQKNFDRVRFIFFKTTLSADEIEKEFSKNLRKGIAKLEDHELDENFEYGANKVEFRIAPNEKAIQGRIRQLLTESGNSSYKYSALWIFTLLDGHSVSFLAEVDFKKIKVLQGVSLNMKQTLERNESLHEIWNSLPPPNTKRRNTIVKK